MDSQVRITTDGNSVGSVFVGDVDVSEYVTAATIQMNAGEQPIVSLKMAPHTVLVELDDCSVGGLNEAYPNEHWLAKAHRELEQVQTELDARLDDALVGLKREIMLRGLLDALPEIMAEVQMNPIFGDIDARNVSPSCFVEV